MSRAGGANLASLLVEESALEGFVRQSVFGVWHASGTCRMGAHADRSAVTDAAGRVHDVGRLRVVDASLMPRLPTANTNIPTIMLAEKIADTMQAERRAVRLASSEVAHQS